MKHLQQQLPSEAYQRQQLHWDVELYHYEATFLHYYLGSYSSYDELQF